MPAKNLASRRPLVALGCILWTVLWALSQPLWGTKENIWRDSWIAQRAHRQEVDSRILLVLIDDASLEKIPQPTAYWLPLLGKATHHCLQAGALVVGVDWMPHEVDEAVYRVIFPNGWGGGEPWTDFGRVGLEFPGKWIQGVFPNLSAHHQRTLRSDYKPAPEVMALAGNENLAYLNLSRDPDGVLRRQSIVPLQGSESTMQSFSARLVEALGSPKLPQEPVISLSFAPASKFPRVSMSDILEWHRSQPDKLREVVAGKVVLLGPGTPLFQDLVTTPLGQMLGVEAHAQAVNTLLCGTRIHPVSALVYWPLALLGFLLAALAGSRLAPVALLALVAAVEIGLIWTAQVQLVSLGRTIPLLPLLTGLPVAALGGWLFQWFEQQQKQKTIRQLFGRYVSPSVMETLLHDPQQALLGAVGRRTITVLFTDINGFSTQCEKRSADEIMEMLNRYFEAMNAIIFENGGTIKQFVGDEIMALYGAPQHHPKPEQAALDTAVAMIRRLRTMKAADPDNNGFYEIKVGIHRGPVILGNVGSAERTEYAAVGDDVNLGARIMSMTGALKADVLISAELQAQVVAPLGVSFRSKGLHPVKGRVEPIEIVEVLIDS